MTSSEARSPRTASSASYVSTSRRIQHAWLPVKIATVLGVVVLASVLRAASDSKEDPVGMWNDRRAFGNTGLYFAADGSGDFISDVCCALKWTFDATREVVSVQLSADKPVDARTLWFRYDPEHRTLSAIGITRGDAAWVFEKLEPPAVDAWLAAKRKNPANQRKG